MAEWLKAASLVKSLKGFLPMTKVGSCYQLPLAGILKTQYGEMAEWLKGFLKSLKGFLPMTKVGSCYQLLSRNPENTIQRDG